MFRDTCRRFAEREIAPIWQEADRESQFPRSFFTAAANAGLIGIAAPAEVGGADLGVHEEAICIEECARVNPGLPNALIIQGVAGGILHDFGTDEQKDLARASIEGKTILAIAVTEPEAGNDVQNVKTTARRDGADWVLDGIKSFITLANEADVLVLLAQTDSSRGREGMSFFAVDRNSPGVEVSRIPTYANRPAPTYRVHLNGVRVPETRRVPAGFRQIMAGFNRERILVSARWFGHMQHAQDWALEYAKTRQQFGRPIGANQSIAFMLAQNQTDIEAARLLAYEAADRWDSGCPISDLIQQVSCAKLFVTQAVVRVTQNALHIGGGWGLTEELPVMRMALDALVAPVTVGSFEIQLRAIAKQLGLPCD
jgi:alkylation response protein AidB-like acyl-CoA dehydrogenase